jgi:hypothetical protein
MVSCPIKATEAYLKSAASQARCDRNHWTIAVTIRASPGLSAVRPFAKRVAVLGRSLLAALVCLALAPLACGDGAPRNPAASAGSAGLGGSGASGGSGGASTDAGPEPSADAALFAKVLAGSLPASDGLIAIAHSGGFPIQTADGFVFAALDDGLGPYRLAGDFNAWTPAEMTSEAGIFWSRVAIAEPANDKYKFVDGSGAFIADPLARRYGHDQYGEHSLVTVTGAHRERFPRVAGASLAPRSVRIWVPDQPPLRHLYVHDGQNLFEPSSPFGGWKLHESVASTTLVVGIDNAGGARMDEYSHVPDLIGGSPVGGKAELYATLVLDVVRPLVEARYGEPERRGVMGSSLGGLVAFFQAERDPGAWQFAASLSGTFGWGSIGAANETLIERFAKSQKLPLLLYLDSGGGAGSGCIDADGDGIFDDSPDSADNFCETAQMKETLEAIGHVSETDLIHFWEPNAKHDEAAWAARVWRPVKQFEALQGPGG